MQDVPLAGKWSRQSFCAHWTAGLNPTVMGFKYSGPPLVIISLLNLEVSSNFNVHLSLWEHIWLSADLVMSVPLKLYNPCGVYRNWNEEKQQSFQKNFPEKSVKHLLLTRLSPATLASKPLCSNTFWTATARSTPQPATDFQVCTLCHARSNSPRPCSHTNISQTAGSLGAGHVGSRRLSLTESRRKYY